MIAVFVFPDHTPFNNSKIHYPDAPDAAGVPEESASQGSRISACASYTEGGFNCKLEIDPFFEYLNSTRLIKYVNPEVVPIVGDLIVNRVFGCQSFLSGPYHAFTGKSMVIASAAAKANLAVVLGTERFVDGALLITALVINRDGTTGGFQDKVQLDPSEEGTYRPGSGRRVFQTGPLTFGVAICHEGWRYPETVRWAVRHGAHIVFHPHFHEADPGGYVPSTFADPANSFHEKAALCRAAENTCFFATVNCASAGSPTTSAVVRPDGTLLTYQPYGKPGLLIADIDLTEATGRLAARYKSV